jgi:hypothetical protein
MNSTAFHHDGGAHNILSFGPVPHGLDLDDNDLDDDDVGRRVRDQEVIC